MKNKIKILLTLLILCATLFTAASCSKSYDSAGDAGAPGYENSFTGGAPDKGDTTLDENLENDRKIIKNVNERIQTDKYDDFLASLNEAVKNAGGYISSANYSGENYFNQDDLRRANLTVRVPAECLSEFTEKIDSLAVVTYYNETEQDVTSAYIDVESRIAVLEAEESALLDILKTSGTTADALAVRTRLLDVQADLASLRAQKNSFDDRVAYSTVIMSITEVRRAVEHNPSFFAEVGATFLNSLHDIGEGIRDFAVWFLGNILYIVIISSLAFGVFLFVRFVVKKWKQKNIMSNDSAERKEGD